MITTKTCDELITMTNDELNDYTFGHFLNSYFYNDWQKEFPRNTLEIIFSPKCNLKCEYCYIHKYSSKTFPNHIFDAKKSIENAVKILDWMGKNNFGPTIELFSGEIFAQKSGYDLFDAMLKFFKEHPDYRRPNNIIIPTNGTFLNSDKYTTKVEEYIKEFEQQNCPLILSFSIDGLLVDGKVRDYKAELDLDEDINLPRDQAYYDKLFQFILKHRYCIHPMLYAKDMHKWIDNFNWFMDMYEKYNIAWWDLYLLEVRNHDWTVENVEDFGKFLNYLMDYAWDKLDHNADLFLDWLSTSPGSVDKRVCAGFNVLFNSFGKSGTGTRCGMQNQLSIRASDLAVYPCHRLMYPGLEIGRFEDDFNFKTEHIELGIATYGFNPIEQNVCNTCAIKHLCVTQCVGAQYETTKDLFTPIPSVCYLNFVKIKTILTRLDELNLLDKFASRQGAPERAEIWQFFNNEIKEKK